MQAIKSSITPSFLKNKNVFVAEVTLESYKYSIHKTYQIPTEDILSKIHTKLGSIKKPMPPIGSAEFFDHVCEYYCDITSQIEVEENSVFRRGKFSREGRSSRGLIKSEYEEMSKFLEGLGLKEVEQQR